MIRLCQSLSEYMLTCILTLQWARGYCDSSPTAVQPCPLCEPSPSRHILL